MKVNNVQIVLLEEIVVGLFLAGSLLLLLQSWRICPETFSLPTDMN